MLIKSTDYGVSLIHDIKLSEYKRDIPAYNPADIDKK